MQLISCVLVSKKNMKEEVETRMNNGNGVEDMDSASSTPYVSAPSSPGRGVPISGYFYSAPASPVHFMLTNSYLDPVSSKSELSSAASVSSSSDFDFSGGRFCINDPVLMSSADELFLNGQIRPMKLSSHLLRPQMLPPLIDGDEINGDDDFQEERERNLKLRSGSLRKRTRSMSPMRTETVFEMQQEIKDGEEEGSSRSSSGRRSSKRWVFLKEFLYRSKSEGRIQKFWFSKSFSPVKDKKLAITPPITPPKLTQTPVSAHELHYTANRAQTEVLRRKTFLPYNQGLLGCLRFSSKSYGAFNGFTGTPFNPLSSR